MYNIQLLSDICLGALEESKKTVDSFNHRFKGISDRGFNNLLIDENNEIYNVLQSYFENQDIPLVLDSKKFHRKPTGYSPKIHITFDNFSIADNLDSFLKSYSNCTVVSIFKSKCPRYCDTVVAGIIDNTSGNYWFASKGNGTTYNGTPCKTNSDKKTIDKNTKILFNSADKENIPNYSFFEEKAFCKDYGSSAIHYSLLSSGNCDIIINPLSLGYNTGAAYLLITKAGGIITDFQGENFERKIYSLNNKLPAVCAANESLLKESLKIIKK